MSHNFDCLFELLNLLFVVLTIYIIAAIPQVALFLMAAVYFLSGPFERFFASKIFKSAHTVENLKEKHTN